MAGMLKLSEQIHNVVCTAVALQLLPGIGEYAMTVSGQRLGNHIPAETNTHAAVDLLLETGSLYGVRTEIL
jgi:hypothetical protein